jgi:hypothetical protein
MLLFIPRSLCGAEACRRQVGTRPLWCQPGIRIALATGLYRAEATDGHLAIVVQGMVRAASRK